ncbi:MAG TPA: ferrous iron transport protein B, partial [Thermoanaerobaculia bacterium]|nr:ferrous iron transport protein B [Thermoanaerobaculia bacterium]
HRFGLHGRAVIPLIAAGGCSVPAIIATRSLGNTRERTIAAVLATLVPCSARTAVIIGAVAGVGRESVCRPAGGGWLGGAVAPALRLSRLAGLYPLAPRG